MTDLNHELPAIGFLAEVADEHRAFLATYGRFLRPKQGDVLIQSGADQESLYFILSGTVHIVAECQQRNILLASLKEGESIGETNLFDPAKASATAVCREPRLIWALSRQELDSFLQADSAAGEAVLKGLLCLMARRIRNMNEKLALVMQQGSLLHP
jgi:CRP-like cAMP-binding protein